MWEKAVISAAAAVKSSWKHHALSVTAVVTSLQVCALVIAVLSALRDVQACDEGLKASFEQAWRPYTVQASSFLIGFSVFRATFLQQGPSKGARNKYNPSHVHQNMHVSTIIEASLAREKQPV